MKKSGSEPGESEERLELEKAFCARVDNWDSEGKKEVLDTTAGCSDGRIRANLLGTEGLMGVECQVGQAGDQHGRVIATQEGHKEEEETEIVTTNAVVQPHAVMIKFLQGAPEHYY